MRYFEAIRAAFTVALDGDRAYSGTFQHNPLAACWRTIAGPAEPYRLADLAAHVDLFAASVPQQHSNRLDEIAQYGRNCSAFALAARRVYGFVDEYRQHNDRASFDARVAAVVTEENSAFDTPLPGSEVRSITRSIAGWTWNVYRCGNGAAKGRRNASERTRAEYLAGAAAARTEARKLHSEGVGASEIARRMKRSRSWVYGALSAASTATVQCCLSEFEAHASPSQPAASSSAASLSGARTPVRRTAAILAIRFLQADIALTEPISSNLNVSVSRVTALRARRDRLCHDLALLDRRAVSTHRTAKYLGESA